MKHANLNSRGTERVCVYGDWMRRTVYQKPNEWVFYVFIDDHQIRVWHKADYFSTTPDEEFIRNLPTTYCCHGCAVKLDRATGIYYVPVRDGYKAMYSAEDVRAYIEKQLERLDIII